VAETAKLLENTFRSVNIALANELALALSQDRCGPLGSHRGRRHQALRLHAVLPGAGDRRLLHSRRPRAAHRSATIVERQDLERRGLPDVVDVGLVRLDMLARKGALVAYVAPSFRNSPGTT
jgi:hypothetical protein